MTQKELRIKGVTHKMHREVKALAKFKAGTSVSDFVKQIIAAELDRHPDRDKTLAVDCCCPGDACTYPKCKCETYRP